MRFKCRPARIADIDGLADMIRRLAAHHGDAATVSPAQLSKHGFGPKPRFQARVAENQDGLIGYALWYVIYNAQSAMVILDLHHLFVDELCRGPGVGAALVAEVAKWAEEEGCDRIRVGVAPNNNLGAAFYRSLGFTERPPNFFVVRESFVDLAKRYRPDRRLHT